VLKIELSSTEDTQEISEPRNQCWEVFPTEFTSDDEMERGLGEWQRINILNKCD
jgi:hypothetical protein